jgi:hypothetical protein
MTSIAIIRLVAEALKEIREMAQYFGQRRMQNREEKEKAVKAVLEAAIATRAYMADIRSGEKACSRDTERELSHLWMKAHHAMANVDIVLADRCMIKADCWSDPRLWTHPQYKHVPIDLDSIIESYRELSRSLAPRRARRSSSSRETSRSNNLSGDAMQRSQSTEGGVLHLTIKREYFDKIISGRKKTEYREIKPYWKKRLEGKTFSEVQFRNGYGRDAPITRVEFKGLSKKQFMGSLHYAIQLGKILEVKNI